MVSIIAGCKCTSFCPRLYCCNLYINILDFSCMCVLWKWDVRGAGLDWWSPTFVLIVLCTACAWSQVDVIGEQHAACEADTILEQHWSRRNQGEAAEADAIGEKLLKRMHSGSSSWSGCNWRAAADVVYRDLWSIPSYVCNEVVCHTVLYVNRGESSTVLMDA